MRAPLNIFGLRIGAVDTPGVPLTETPVTPPPPEAPVTPLTDLLGVIPDLLNFSTSVPADGSDGGSGGKNPLEGLVTFFFAIRDNGGVVQRCSYIATVQPPFLAQFTAAGFTPQVFLVNQNGAAVSQTLMAATTVTGVLPFGTVEQNTFLTQDGLTNLTRYLVYMA